MIIAWTDRSTENTKVTRIISARAATAAESDKRSRRPTLLQRAGIPENVLGGGVVMFTAVRQGFIGESLSRIRPDHVWVFLLLDQEGRVQDYRFFSFDQLREAERAEQERK